MAFCVNCGSSLPQGASFCPNCGTDLRAWMQQPPVASAPQATVPTQQPGMTVPQWNQAVQQAQVQPPVPVAKPEPVPGKSQAKAGKILSVLGFALSIVGLVTTFTFMTLMMSMNNIWEYKKLVVDFGLLGAESLLLSILGVIFATRGEKKGNFKVRGKRLGWLGIAFSAIAAVNVILFVIVFAFGGRALSV